MMPGSKKSGRSTVASPTNLRMHLHGARVPWRAVGVAAALLVVPRAASAEPADPQALFREGVEHMKAERIAEAEAKLQASWDLYRTYDTAANLAECEAKLGQRAEAAEHMDFAVRHLPNHIQDEMRSAMKKRAADLRAEVGALRVVVTADGAAVTVGGRAVGKSPIADEVFVEPGEILVAATAAGSPPAEARVRVGRGERQDVRLELRSGPSPTVTPPPGDEAPGSSPWPSVFLIGGASVAAVGLGVAITGVAVAGSKGSDADAQLAAISQSGGRCPEAPECAALDETLRDQSTFDDVGIIGFVGLGVGLAAVAIGVVLAATSDDVPGSSAVAPGPAPLGSDLGGSLRLRF